MGFFVQLYISWQDFNRHSASRGPSVVAELLVFITTTYKLTRGGWVDTQQCQQCHCWQRHGDTMTSWWRSTDVTQQVLLLIWHSFAYMCIICEEAIGPTRWVVCYTRHDITHSFASGGVSALYTVSRKNLSHNYFCENSVKWRFINLLTLWSEKNLTLINIPTTR